jgi:hypothetical protein
MSSILVFSVDGVCVHYIPDVPYHSGGIESPLVKYLSESLPLPYYPIGKTQKEIESDTGINLKEEET